MGHPVWPNRQPWERKESSLDRLFIFGSWLLRIESKGKLVFESAQWRSPAVWLYHQGVHPSSGKRNWGEDQRGKKLRLRSKRKGTKVESVSSMQLFQREGKRRRKALILLKSRLTQTRFNPLMHGKNFDTLISWKIEVMIVCMNKVICCLLNKRDPWLEIAT